MEEIALPDGRRAQLWTGAAAPVHAHPARSTLSSVADDAVAVLDALGLERVGVLGSAQR